MRVLSLLKTNTTLPTGRAECVQGGPVWLPRITKGHRKGSVSCAYRPSSSRMLEGMLGSGAVGAAGERDLVVQTCPFGQTIGRGLMRLGVLVHRQASHHHTPSSSEPAHSYFSTSWDR